MTRIRGTCPRCGEGWCVATWSGPAEACACPPDAEDDGEPNPWADEGQSDARALARDRWE